MASKLFGTFLIMGVKWPMYVTDELPETIDGLTTFKPKKKMEIASRLDKEEFMATCMHEVGHATLHELGMHLTGLTPEVEELLVDSIAKAICKNFKLVKKLERFKK